MELYLVTQQKNQNGILNKNNPKGDIYKKWKKKQNKIKTINKMIDLKAMESIDILTVNQKKKKEVFRLENK